VIVAAGRRATGPGGVERRLSPRLGPEEIGQPVLVVGSRLVNISRGGVMLEAPVPLAPGSMLHLRLVVAGERSHVEAACGPACRARRDATPGGEWASSSRTSLPRRSRASTGPSRPGGGAPPRVVASVRASSRAAEPGGPRPLERGVPRLEDTGRGVRPPHVLGRRRAEPGAGLGVAGEAEDRPGEAALLVRHVDTDHHILRQVGLVGEVGDDRCAPLGEDAQERRRGLARSG